MDYFPCNSATYPCTGLFMGSCHVWASHGRVSGPNHTRMLHFSLAFPVLMSFYSQFVRPTLFPNPQTDVSSLIARFMSSPILYLMGLCAKSHPEKLGESVLGLLFQIPSLHGNTEFFLGQMVIWFLGKDRKLVLRVDLYSRRDYIIFLFLSPWNQIFYVTADKYY